MSASTTFVGVVLLTLVAPFEFSEPLVRLPGQSVSNLEAAIAASLGAAAVATVWSRGLPRWRTPLTAPWVALLAAMAVASALAPAFRTNAFHMTGRLAAACAVYLLTVNAVTTRARMQTTLVLMLAAGVLVSVLAILEYLRVGPVLSGLQVFRPGVTVVGAQLRAGGPLQYPTIASMYLEVVFALGLGLLLSAFDAARRVRVAVVFVFVALAVVAEAITLTFTRAGLITMAASLAFVGLMRRQQRGAEMGGALVLGLAVVVAALFLGSRSAQSVWLRLTTEGQETWYRMQVDAPSVVELSGGAMATVPITVTNTGRLVWDSQSDPPFFLSYHWLQADGDRFVTFDGLRTAFDAPVEPGRRVSMRAHVRAPRRPGRYRLVWDIVQEGRLWFSTEPGATPITSRAMVRGAAPDEVVLTTPPPRPTVRLGRLALWRAAARMVAAHPLLGVGPDNFRLSYGAYAGLANADTRTHSNNMYLEMLAGGGLTVGVAFAWLLWRAAVCFAGCARAAASSGATAAIGVAAAGLAVALHSVVDAFLSFAPTYVLFSLTLGCAAAWTGGLEMGSDAHRV